MTPVKSDYGFLSISLENMALWSKNDAWIHFHLLCFPVSSCLLVVDLHFFSFLVKHVKLNRICHMIDCDKFTIGNREKSMG